MIECMAFRYVSTSYANAASTRFIYSFRGLLDT